MMLLVFITHAENVVHVFLEVNFGGARTEYSESRNTGNQDPES